MAGIRPGIALLCVCTASIFWTSALGGDHKHSFHGLTISVDRVQTGEDTFPNNYLIIEITQADGSRVAAAKQPIEGTMDQSWVRDMDGDRNPEIVVATHSFGSGSYGDLVFFEYENGAFELRTLPAMPQQFSNEYRGHDAFATSSHDVSRRFPLYSENDANCCPTGGDAEIEYAYTANQLIIKDIDLNR